MQTAPQLDLSAIPAAQRAAVLALMEKVAALTEITQRQEHLIAELNHALHGKRSEKLTEDERQLAFEDLSIALAEVEVQKEHLAAKAGDKTATRPAPKRTIGNLPAALPRIEEVVEPDSLICPWATSIWNEAVRPTWSVRSGLCRFSQVLRRSFTRADAVQNSVILTISKIQANPKGPLNPSTLCQTQACCSLKLWQSNPICDGGRFYSILCGRPR